MFEVLFNMWLEGVQIIISFIPLGIALFVVTALLIVTLDLFACALFSDIYEEYDLLITKCFLPEGIYKKIYNLLNRK